MSDNINTLGENPDAMTIYEFIVNHPDSTPSELDELIYMLERSDPSGQFLASTARFLAAIDREKYASVLPKLVEGAIERDRERKYIGALLQALWGDDYMEHADELRASDDNFRRIFKRVYSSDKI